MSTVQSLLLRKKGGANQTTKRLWIASQGEGKQSIKDRKSPSDQATKKTRLSKE